MNKYILNIENKVDNEGILVVKKSKFIAKVFNISSKEQAEKIIEEIKIKYNDARHIVYAYMLMDGGKYSDDREPQGTAGKPIYMLLENEKIVNVMVVVIRYFGGILLGTGPLTRAYLGVAKQVIDMYEKKKYVEYIDINIVFEYKEEEIVKKIIEKTNSNILETIRDSKVQMSLKLPKDNTRDFLKYIE